MKKIIISAILIFSMHQMFGQQDPHFTMYMFNKQVLNPAYSGSLGLTNITGMYRNQWTAFNGNPTTVTLGIHSPVGQAKADIKRVALGLYAFSDKLGVSETFGLYGQYAYRIPVGDQGIISLGLQAGFINYSNNLTQLSPGQTSDPVLNTDIKNSLLPNFGAGIYYYTNRFYIGGSVPHLIQNKYDKNAVDVPGQKAARQYLHEFLMTGYVFDLGPTVKLKPNILLKYVTGNNVQVPFDADFNLSLFLFNRFELGGSYRLDDSFDAFTRFQISKNLSAGYAYDFTVSDLSRFDNGGTHELVISYQFGQKLQTFTTPRFIKYF